jgi:MFS family permease
MALLATNRSYRFLFSTSAGSNLGDGISAPAFPWLASLITRDSVLISPVASATRLPWFLFSLPAGIITDRYDRRVLIVRADLFRFLSTGGVIALIFAALELPITGDPLIYILALSGLAILLGTAEVIRDNAAQTVLPSIVAKAKLESANGQMWSIEHIMGSFVGPPLAGVLIALAVSVPFAVEAVTCALAAWLVSMIALPARPHRPKRKIWPEVVEDWTWIRNRRVVLRLAVMLGLINAFSIMIFTVLMLFSQDILGLGPVEHGVVLTAGAANGMVRELAGPRIVVALSIQRSIFAAMLMFPVPFIMIALTSNAYVVAVALFLEMIGALLYNIGTVYYRQRLVPDDLLGRVNSIYCFFGWGMMPFRALTVGLLVSWAEPDLGREAALRLPFIDGAVGMGAMFAYGLAKLRL